MSIEKESVTKKLQGLSLLSPTNYSSQVNIFSLLHDVENLTACNNENTLATSYGLYTTLIHILGDTAHVVHPDLSSVSALMSDDPEERKEAAINYAKAIAGYESGGQIIANGFIHQDGGQLAKPIVMLLNTASAKANNQQDTEAEGGSHWVMCVILPKVYQTPRGIQINNAHEKIYFIDPLFQDVKLPQEFKAILKYGVKSIIPHAGIDVFHNIPAAFPDAEFIDCTNVFQQAGGSVDCGWWSLYDALEIVATGNVAFLGQFSNSQYQNTQRQSGEFAFKLRGLFPQLASQDITLSQKSSQKSKSQKEGKSEIPHKEMVALQIAIEESIKTYNTYQARSDAVHGRRGNDYQTLVLLHCALENYFKGIQFTLKTEVDDGTDIDDLECQVGNQLKKYQIKHASNKDDYYTPADLLHVTKSKLVDSKLGDSTKGGAPLVHFFESWYSMKYIKKDHKGLQIEYALYTNYDFNAGCLKGLLNPITKIFYPDFFGVGKTANGKKLNSAQQKFKNELVELIQNLKIIENLTLPEKNQKIIEFFSEFKFLLKQPYIDELEKNIRKLLSENNINEDSIYFSLYYKYNIWLRTRLKDSSLKDNRAKIITDVNTKEMLLELEVKCKLLQRLVGQSQYYLNKTIQTTINGFVISRKNEHDQLHQALITSSIIFIKGEKGTGKSAFIKNYIETHKWQDAVLFFKDEDDFKTVSSIANNVNLSDFLKYFLGIKLIVIDSAETWVSNYTEEKKRIFQALLSQDQIPVVCTITENVVGNFIEKFLNKHKKHAVISMNFLAETDVNNLLKPYISESALLAIQSNKATMNTCRILFWLNNFIKHCDTLSSELPGILNEGNVIEYISKKTVEGNNKALSKGRILVWFAVCVQSRANINMPVNLGSQNNAVVESLEQDQILIKNTEGNYVLQHDLFYDTGMRFYFDKKLKYATIENRLPSLLIFINEYIKSNGIQFRLIAQIKNLYQYIQEPISAIQIYICAAIFAEHDEALKHLLNLIDPRTLKNSYFMGSYYADFYMVAICADNFNAVHILESKKTPFFVDKIKYQSSEDSQTDEDKNSAEETSESDNDYVRNSNDSHSVSSDQSVSIDDPYAEWYKYPKKYCFANFRSEFYEIEYDSYGEPLPETEDFDEEPDDNNHFQYFIFAVKNESYKSIRGLIYRRPDFLVKQNNFGENPLHYATKINNLDLVDFLLEFPKINECVNADDQLGETPLHNACYVENSEIVSSLLEAGANPNAYNSYNVTPFHVAIAKQDREIIKLLFDYGADVTQHCYDEDCSLIQFIANVTDDDKNDDFILFLMKLFNYGCCTIESLQDIDELLPQDKKELIGKYQNLTHDEFNIWVRKKYSVQEALCNEIIMRFNNIKFSYDLESLLNYTKLSDDHSYIKYYDEASQFDHYLEKEKYFEAIDCLSEIDADDIKSVFDQMDKNNNDLKDEMINHLTEMHQAWDQLAIFAFAYDDEQAKDEIVKYYLNKETIPKLLKVALDDKDDDMFSAICDEIQWDDDIVDAIKEYFGNSNKFINKMLLEKSVLLENKSKLNI